jgi:two-component system cell cycle sensor histidine kinase/response regulator CckA
MGELPLAIVIVRRGFPAVVTCGNTALGQLLALPLAELPTRSIAAVCSESLSAIDSSRVLQAVDVGLARSFPVVLTRGPAAGQPVSLHVIPLPDVHGLAVHCALVFLLSPNEATRFPPSPPQPASHLPSGTPLEPQANGSLDIILRMHEASPIGFAAVDPQGRLSASNSAFARFLNLTPASLGDGRALREVSPDLARASQQAKSSPVPVALNGTAGATDALELSVTEMEVGQAAWRLLTVQDVRSRRLEEARREEARRLESLGVFASGIAHDFNNLLTIILGYGGLIRDTAPQADHLTRAVHAILEAGQRGADIVRQLQLFAHRHPPDCSPVNLHALIDEAITQTFSTPPEDIRIVRSLTSSPFAVDLDASQVLLSLRHLLQNARDAMEQGGSLTVRTTLLREPASTETDLTSTVAVSIEDEGPGMDEASRIRLFEPFAASKSRSTIRGLGLAVVYGIVRAHRGSIDVTSEPNRGTRISLRLPCRELPAPAAPRLAAAAAAEARGGTVLIVEDELDIGRLWEGLLSAQRIPHLWARDGEAALSLFQTHRGRIDLLFTDVGLPGMNGWALARALRESEPTLPILMTSGAFQPGDRAASGLAEPLVCLSKPFFPATVIQHIQRLLQSPSADPASPGR